MTREQIRKILEDKEKELKAALRTHREHLQESARGTGAANHHFDESGRDLVDLDTTTQDCSRRARLLSYVQAALKRVADGTYGRCLECDQKIEPKRLNAVPWTSLCGGCQTATEEQPQTSGPRRRRPANKRPNTKPGRFGKGFGRD